MGRNEILKEILKSNNFIAREGRGITEGDLLIRRSNEKMANKIITKRIFDIPEDREFFKEVKLSLGLPETMRITKKDKRDAIKWERGEMI